MATNCLPRCLVMLNHTSGKSLGKKGMNNYSEMIRKMKENILSCLHFVGKLNLKFLFEPFNVGSKWVPLEIWESGLFAF